METERQLAERLGAAIRQARVARGWSQATLAEKTDLSVTYIGMLERGEKLASLPALIEVASLLGTNVSRLAGEPGAEPWLDEAVTLLRAVPEPLRGTILVERSAERLVVGEPARRERLRSRGRRLPRHGARGERLLGTDIVALAGCLDRAVPAEVARHPLHGVLEHLSHLARLEVIDLLPHEGGAVLVVGASTGTGTGAPIAAIRLAAVAHMRRPSIAPALW